MEYIYILSDAQIQKKIGEKIKATRLKQNITQNSLAESASISRSSVQKVESGEIKEILERYGRIPKQTEDRHYK